MAGAVGSGTSRVQGNGSLPTITEIFEACSSWHRRADMYQVSNGIVGIKGGSTISFSFLEGGVVGTGPPEEGTGCSDPSMPPFCRAGIWVGHPEALFLPFSGAVEGLGGLGGLYNWGVPALHTLP